MPTLSAFVEWSLKSWLQLIVFLFCQVYPQRTLESGFKFQYPTVQACAAALVTKQ
jgi:NAD dependent epimerase/dehydratase family enzyme